METNWYEKAKRRRAEYNSWKASEAERLERNRRELIRLSTPNCRCGKCKI